MSDFGSPSFGQDDPFAPKPPASSGDKTVFSGAKQPEPDSFGNDIPPISAPDSFSGDIPAGVPVEAPKKNNRTLWIILIIVALLLCCCCIVLVIVGFNMYDSSDFQNMFEGFSFIAPSFASLI